MLVLVFFTQDVPPHRGGTDEMIDARLGSIWKETVWSMAV